MKFTWGDTVTVRYSAAAELRPGNRAWVVGMSDQSQRSGDYLAEFPFGYVYTIEFEDGASANVAEVDLQAT